MLALDEVSAAKIAKALKGAKIAIGVAATFAALTALIAVGLYVGTEDVAARIAKETAGTGIWPFASLPTKQPEFLMAVSKWSIVLAITSVLGLAAAMTSATLAAEAAFKAEAAAAAARMMKESPAKS